MSLNLPSLSERAVIVRLQRSMYQPYAYDLGQTVKVEIDTGVRKAGRFNKRLFLDCYELRDCNSAFNDVYSYHMLHSVPWLDDGARMIPSAQYFDYTQAMRELIAKAEKAADTLAANWDRLVAADMQRLGPLANSNDYPANIRACYGVKLKFMPVPETSDFRVAISDEDKESLNSAIREAEAGVSKYLLTEMLEPVKRAIEKLAVPIGADGSIFRNSLISNMSEVAQRARKLNVNHDPAITALCDEITAAIGGYAANSDRLREDVDARAAAKAKLDAISAKMGAFMGMAA